MKSGIANEQMVNRNWLRGWRHWLCLLTLVMSIFLPHSVGAFSEKDLPAPRGDIYVQDFVGVISPEVQNGIRGYGRLLDDKTGAQIVVATMPSLPDGDIETYATALYRHWQIGDKKLNNGVLLLVIPEVRKVRIEVGYGLEGALNDAKVGSILDRYFIPAIRQGNVDTAISQTYVAILSEVMKEYHLSTEELKKPGRIDVQARTEHSGELNWQHVAIAMIVFFLMILDLFFNRGRLTRLVIYAFLAGRGGGGGGGGFRGGGGGSSGGGGASRSW